MFILPVQEVELVEFVDLTAIMIPLERCRNSVQLSFINKYLLEVYDKVKTTVWSCNCSCFSETLTVGKL
jgi:hypothetical protein